MRSKILGAALTVTVLAVGLPSAAFAASGPAKKLPPANSSQRTLTVAAAAVSGGFDTTALQASTQATVFGGLAEPLLTYATKAGPNGSKVSNPSKIVGDLVKSWTEASNHLSYTFTLRQGIMSNYGHELTATDVAWSWDKAFAEKRTGASLAAIAKVTSVTVVSKYVVRFTLSGPSASLLPTLAIPVPAILDATEMKLNATATTPWGLSWLTTHIASFGAYQVTSVTPNEQSVFTVNPHYFKGTPYFTKVIYREASDTATAAQLLASGEVDVDDEVGASNAATIKSSPSSQLLVFPSSTMDRFFMNVTDPPFTNKLVRQALSYATPYKQILGIVYLGYATQLRGPLPSNAPGYDPSSWKYTTNYAKARKLLKQAGYPNGITVTLAYSALAPWEQPAAIQFQNGAAKAGIHVNLKLIPNATMQADAAQGKRSLPFFAYTDAPFVLDPSYTLPVYLAKTGCCDRGNYDNPQVNALLTKIGNAPLLSTREQLAKQVQQIVNADAPAIFIAQEQTLVGLGRGIDGYVYHPDNHERWADLYRAS